MPRTRISAAFAAVALLGLALAPAALAAPAPTVLLPNLTVTESDDGAADVMVNVALDRPNPYPFTVSVHVYDFTPVPVPGTNPPRTYGTATPGADYVPTGGFYLQWRPKQQIATFPVTLLGDALNETNENINIRFDAPNGVTIGDNDTNIVVGDNEPVGIVDPLAPPTIMLPNATIPEPDSGCAPYQVALNLTHPAPAAASLVVYDYTTVPVPGSNPPRTYGSATPGVDYVSPGSFTLNFPAGASTATFPVRICGDTVPEGDEEIDIRVVAPQGITIADNDLDLILANDD